MTEIRRVEQEFRLSVIVEHIDGRDERGVERTSTLAELTVPIDGDLAFEIYLSAATRAVAPSPVYVRSPGFDAAYPENIRV